MMLRTAAGLAALTLLAACASNAPPASTPRLESAAAQRGRSLAEVRCAGCHAIGEAGESPRTGAPPFGRVRLRYNALSWPRVMQEIAEGRHGEMPPVTLTQSEIEDVRAYIDTLR